MYADGGIADLPAPNMESMDMASGGIVAFNGEKGSEVEDEQARKDREALKYGWENTKAAARDILTLPGRGLAGAFETAVTRPVRALGVDMPYLPSSFYGGDASSLTPHMDTLTRRRESQAASNTTPTVNSTPTQAEIDAIRATAASSAAPAGGSTKAQIDALNARPRVGAGAPDEKAGLGATDEFKSYMDTVKKERADSMAELKGLSAKQREAALAAKSQGLGDFLMNISQGLLNKRGLAAGTAAGLPGATAAAAASRKEQNALNQSANDFDFNIAKSREAAAKGDMEAALQYKKLAQDAQYQQGMLAYHNASLNKPDSGIAMLNALKNPENMAIFKDMYANKKGDVYSIDKAIDDFNGVMKDPYGPEAKRLKALGITNAYQYQQYQLQQNGGGGINPFQNAASAEAKKRGIS
jgi:hypothetical protein